MDRLPFGSNVEDVEFDLDDTAAQAEELLRSNWPDEQPNYLSQPDIGELPDPFDEVLGG